MPSPSDYQGVSVSWQEKEDARRERHANADRCLNDLLEFAEKEDLTFRFRRHGSGEYWMIECQGPYPIDGVVEHTFYEKEDLSFPLRMCIEVLKIAKHDARLKEKNTPRPLSSG